MRSPENQEEKVTFMNQLNKKYEDGESCIRDERIVGYILLLLIPI